MEDKRATTLWMMTSPDRRQNERNPREALSMMTSPDRRNAEYNLHRNRPQAALQKRTFLDYSSTCTTPRNREGDASCDVCRWPN